MYVFKERLPFFLYNSFIILDICFGHSYVPQIYLLLFSLHSWQLASVGQILKDFFFIQSLKIAV